MKAAVWNQDRELVITERDLPEPGPDWLRIRLGMTGICGTDLHVKHGGMLPAVPGTQPGHEMAGIVDAVGDGVSLSTGTAIAIEPLHSCGQCIFCRSGQHNICTGGLQIMGLGVDGGMAEYLLVHKKQAYPLAPNLDMSISALSEPMAVAVRGLRLGQVVQGTSVAILGAGTIGLMCVAVARASGAREILITARYEHQADLARHFGATGVYKDSGELMKAAVGLHIDSVIETVGGTATTLSESVMIAGQGGRIVMLGLFEGSPALPALPFLGKELSLLASNCYAFDCGHSEFGMAVDLVGKLNTELAPVITHTFSLDQINEAFDAAGDKSSKSVKVQIKP